MSKEEPSEPVLCSVCLFDDNVETPAHLVRKGEETDQYVCDKGHEFSLDHEVER